MYKLLKPILFSMQPEEAHHFTMKLFRTALSVPGMKGFFRGQYTYKSEALRKDLFNLSFKNPVGLAAGFDKDGKYIDN